MAGISVASSMAGGMVMFAVSKGADAAELLRRAGISPEALKDRDARIPLERYQALVEAGKALTGDENLSLHFGQMVDMSELSVVGLITLASKNMLDAYHQINRYGRLVIDVGTPDGGNRYRLDLRGQELWLVDTSAPDYFPELAEAPFSFMVCGVRRFTPNRMVHKVRLKRAPPANTAEYEAVFECPVQFGASENAMLMDPAWPETPVSQSPAYAFGILCQHADNMLAKLDADQSLADRVTAKLLPGLHTGEAGADRIARSLGMSRQTLYRRLKEEGTSFAVVLDDLRRSLANELIANPRLSVNEIAYLTGFSDPAAFSRAFKRWTGQSPRAARQK